MGVKTLGFLLIVLGVLILANILGIIKLPAGMSLAQYLGDRILGLGLTILGLILILSKKARE